MSALVVGGVFCIAAAAGSVLCSLRVLRGLRSGASAGGWVTDSAVSLVIVAVVAIAATWWMVHP